LQEIQSSTIFNDVNFWINVVVGLFAFIGIFVIGGLKKDVENLYEKVNKHETRISFIEGKTDIEQKRD